MTVLSGCDEKLSEFEGEVWMCRNQEKRTGAQRLFTQYVSALRFAEIDCKKRHRCLRDGAGFVGLAMTPVIQRSPSPGIDENTRSRSHRLGVSPARLYRYIPVARTAITPIG